VQDQDKKLKGRDKLILINGSVLDQEKHFKKPIYFDQAGKLTSRFGITHVPAIITQEGMKLIVTEVML
jgi:conjugal transfer pilus assembly protein TraW